MIKESLDDELDEIAHPSREELDAERDNADREIRYDIKFMVVAFLIVVLLGLAGSYLYL